MTTKVADIPKASTPTGGYGAEMPPAILADCTDPLIDGAPDLRGTWRVIDAQSDGVSLPDGHPIWQHVERIEQAADRVVITGGGVVHDMWADGTVERGVRDVMAADFTTSIVVAASFEDGVLVLRPRDMPGIEVRRWRDDREMVWQYHIMFTARLERIDT